MNYTFNPTLPKYGVSLEAPSINDIANVSCYKYADIEYVLSVCDNAYVKYVLNKIPIFNKHKRVLIDIKVHDLSTGDYACIPGWHLDGSINPYNLPKKPETFTLFVTGVAALTEFLAKPISFEIDESLDFAARSNLYSRKIPKCHPVTSIPSVTFATYDDSYYHRGKASSGNERRLLIRTTETDIIAPKNSIYTPYRHS